MAKIPECLISVELANALRSVVDAMSLKVPGGDLGFLCPSCRNPVRPHGGANAHFEHLTQNPDCPLSHVA